MLKTFVTAISLLTVSSQSLAVEWDIRSARLTLSKPDTSHTLISRSQTTPEEKSVFNLTPQNNERLGLFLDINGVEIGYAVDVFDNTVETKTQNFLISYRKWKHSKITFNYQTLEGLDIEAENLSGVGFQEQFSPFTESKKIELFGLHNLHTFNDKESLFGHFFLNRPKLSNQFDWALSIVGGWSLKRLSLKNPNSILFTPEFASQDISSVTELNSTSINANIGPLLSIGLPRNFHMFAEFKVGTGHINNANKNAGLKDSGNEKASAIGAGLSWTSASKKTLVLLRGWRQKGRHVETSFGDLSVVRFF